MFCPYCGSKKTDGVDVCPVCGGVPEGYDSSEDVTRLIQVDEQKAVEQKINQTAPPGMEWQQNILQPIPQQSEPQQGYPQGMPQQGYPQGMPQQGFPVGQPGQTQWDVPSEEPKKEKKKEKKSKKGLIIALAVVAVVLIAGVITAYFLFRGGYSSPEAATRGAMNAMVEKDAQKFADSLSDDMYDKLCDLLDDEMTGVLGGTMDLSSGKNLKKNLIKIMDSAFNAKLENVDSSKLEYDYEINGVEDMDDDEMEEYEELIELYDGYDEIKLVSLTFRVNHDGEEDEEEMVDICYKKDGRWYSSMVVQAVAPAYIRYMDKSSRADDVCAAETINSATGAALSNEDAYDEVAEAIHNDTEHNGVAIATAPEDGKFTLCGSNGIKNGAKTFISEINTSLGDSAPKIKYQKDGASYWTIGISGDGKPKVWLGTSEGDTTWELQPNICIEYK